MKGYNPHKPGRPSHTFHTYFIAYLRLILEVEAQAGNQSASKYSSPGLWDLLGRLPRAHWPVCIRGDRDWGTEANMARAEQQGVGYLFKLRLTAVVKKTIERLMRGTHWCDAGQGWQGAETSLRLSGWSRSRRAVVLRRRVQTDLAVVDAGNPEQLRLSFAELTDEVVVYEYAVLITSLGNEILTIAQLYRDRGDAENPFDELKNHWGWGGFTTPRPSPRGPCCCTRRPASLATAARPASPSPTPTPRPPGWSRCAGRYPPSSRPCAKLRSSSIPCGDGTRCSPEPWSSTSMAANYTPPIPCRPPPNPISTPESCPSVDPIGSTMGVNCSI